MIRTVEAEARIYKSVVSIDVISHDVLTFESDVSIITKGAEPYKGAYYAVPRAREQTVPCKDFYMQENFSVKAIPVQRTTNVFGTTVSIGS